VARLLQGERENGGVEQHENGRTGVKPENNENKIRVK
jgi:hypothetical protein